MNITIIYDKACPVFYVVGCNSFFQPVTDREKVNLRMFPTRKYNNCRNWSKQIVINTYVITQQMRNDKIRHVVYNVYVQL